MQVGFCCGKTIIIEDDEYHRYRIFNKTALTCKDFFGNDIKEVLSLCEGQGRIELKLMTKNGWITLCEERRKKIRDEAIEYV